MLHVVQRVDQNNLDLIDQMFKLRARQFLDRRHWSVKVVDGRERDSFDDLHPIYIITADRERRLIGSLRILPTTGPHMLADVFPEIMGEDQIIRHPLIWESSRFCVDTEAANRYGPGGVNMATAELLSGLFATALEAGMVNIVSVYDLAVERILRRTGCVFDRIGAVVEYDGLKTTAGLFEVSARAVENIQSHCTPGGLT
jgi:acyl homoserine lactone synthase